MTPPTFEPFPKIPRLRRGCVVTEKIDGTNASVHIAETGEIFAGSRNRWLTPEADNYGFCKWVNEHAEELKALGPGTHFGEWWGSGIQRNYGLSEKRFSLFNTHRWNPNHPPPECCGVVPVLGGGPFTDGFVAACLERLRTQGSLAAPGWMKPEGIVIWHSASRELSKVPLENDDEPKGKAA